MADNFPDTPQGIAFASIGHPKKAVNLADGRTVVFQKGSGPKLIEKDGAIVDLALIDSALMLLRDDIATHGWPF